MTIRKEVNNNCLLPKETLGKRGDKADLDAQPQDRFDHREARVGIAQGDRLGEEASSMKAAQTQHKRFVPPQMRRGEMAGQQIEAHKAKGHQQIRQKTALWSVSVACHEIQEMGKHPCAKLTYPLPKRYFGLDHLEPEDFALEHIGPVSEACSFLIKTLGLKRHRYLTICSHCLPVLIQTYLLILYTAAFGF